jgi:hypothetical protein
MSGRVERAPTTTAVPETAETGSPRSVAQVVRDIVLFFAGPFITIAYLALFPFIAVSMLRKARRDRKAAA